jgi:hypothetical protein
LTLVGSDLTIENGNTVTLPSGDGNGILDGGQNEVIPSNSRFRFPIAPGLGTNGSEMIFGFPSGTNRNSSGFVYVSEDYDPASAAFSFAVDDLGNYVDSQFAFDDGDNTTRYKPGENIFSRRFGTVRSSVLVYEYGASFHRNAFLVVTTLLFHSLDLPRQRMVRFV